ncbi:MAG: hypothetical protein ABJG78_02315 [Cyclobacteriaceae bacterium]
MKATLIKKRVLPILVLSLISSLALSQQHSAGVNIDNPNPNAVLHLVSPFNDQGLLVPKLTTTQRTTLGTTLAAKNDAAADNGIMVYDADEDAFYFWVTGVGWVKMAVDQTLANVLANGADANGIVITGAGNPVNPQDVATKDYVDNQADSDNQDLNNVLNVNNSANNNAITNLLDPANPQDAATKNYVDAQAGVTVDGTSINGDGNITPLSVNIGTGAGQIVQLGAGSQLPAVDGSLLTGVTSVIGANSVNGTGIADGSIEDVDVSGTANIAWTKISKTGAVLSDFSDDVGFITSELDAVWIADRTTLGSVGAINTPANLIDWTQLKNVPAAFSDGTDDGIVTELDAVWIADRTTLGSAGAINTPANLIDWTQLKNVPGDFSDGIDNGIVTELDPVWTTDRTTLGSAGAINTPANLIDWSQLKGVPTAFSDGIDDGVVTELDPIWTADRTTLGAVGSINTPANLVDWSQLKGVPNDFSDGIDDLASSGNGVTITGGNADLGGVLTGNATITTGAAATDLIVNGAGTLDVDAIANFSAQTTIINIDVTGGTIANTAISQADTQFTLFDGGTGTKTAQFDLSPITGGASRTFALPDADGTLALEGGINLQSAYTSGNTILTDATGPFDVSGTQPISLDGTGLSNFSATGGNLDLNTFTSGSININSIQDLNLTAGPSNSITLNGPTNFTGNIVGASPLVFDGSIEDANTTTFAITNPLGVRTITFPDASGDVLLSPGALPASLALTTNGLSQIVTASDAETFAVNSDIINLGNAITDQLTFNGEILGALNFEGGTNNDIYTTLAVEDPSGPQTIMLPDASGDVVLSPSPLSLNLALTSDGNRQAVSAADAQSFNVNSDVINLGNPPTPAVINIRGNFTFDEASNDLIVEAIDQTALGSTLRFPDLVGLTDTVAVLSDLTNSPWTGSPDISFNTGRVGIGTTTPVTDLHIYNTLDQAKVLTLDAQGATSMQSAGIVFTTLGDGINNINNAATNGWLMLGYGDSFSDATRQNDLTFATFTGATETSNVLHLDAVDGNVGVGTGDPLAPFQIGNNLGLFHFDDMGAGPGPDPVVGEVIADNIHPIGTDVFYTHNAHASMIFMGEGNISFLTAGPTAGAAGVTAFNDLGSVLELDSVANAYFSGAVGFDDFNSVGTPDDGMIRFDGTALQGRILGQWYDLVDTTFYEDASFNHYSGSTTAQNINTGFDNIFMGRNAGAGIIVGSSNITIGPDSDVSDDTDFNTAIGNTAIADGGTSVAIGPNTFALDSSVVIGNGAISGFENAIAIGAGVSGGQGASVNAPFGVALGYDAEVGISNDNAVAIGANSSGLGIDAVSLGSSSTADGDASIAIGTSANTGNTALDAIAIGLNASALANENIAIGHQSRAMAANAIAVGGGTTNTFGAEANGISSIAIGYDAIAQVSAAVAIGSLADVGTTADSSIAIGVNARVLSAADNSISIGQNAFVPNPRAIAIGGGFMGNGGAEALGNESIAIGYEAITNNPGSVALGGTANTGGIDAIAIGPRALADNPNSIAIGNGSLGAGGAEARSDQGIAIGFEAEVQNASDNSIAIGNTAQISAPNAVAIGSFVTASASTSIAIGNNAQANGAQGVALGFQSRADETNSAALGNFARVNAGGTESVAIGSGAATASPNTILLGVNTHTVEIPGDIEISGNVVSVPNPAPYLVNSGGQTIPVPSSRVLRLQGSGGISTVSNIDATGVPFGQEIILLSINLNLTIESNNAGPNNILLNTNANFTMTRGSTLHLMYVENPMGDGTHRWLEIGRSGI